MPIYANNAGTTYPKPPGVAEAVATTHAADPSTYPAIFSDARATIAKVFTSAPVRRRRQRERAEISGLFGSKRTRFQRQKRAWAASGS